MGQEMQNERLDPLAEKIISMLVYEETFVNLLEDLRGFNEYAVADELKQLIAKDFVRPCRDVENDKKSGVLYDSDRMASYSFTLTGKGLTYLEKHLA